MSWSDTAFSDAVHHHHLHYYRNNIKRKLDDYAPTDNAEDDDDDVVSSDLVSVRMRKVQPDAVKSNSSSNPVVPDQSIKPRVSDAQSGPSFGSIRSSARLQFFVRVFSEGKSLVLQANPDDTVQSIHEKIQSVTRIPAYVQRLIYQGKQLEWERTLSQCSIQNDTSLQLVGRMRSTEHPQAFQVIDEMNSLICLLCKGEASRASAKRVKSKLAEFLKMTLQNDGEQAAGHFRIFLSSCSAPDALVMLYMSPFKGNKECADESIRVFVNSCKKTLPKYIHSQFAPVVLEFCKLLSRRATHNDPLYNFCRSSLGSMVEHIGVGRNWDGNKSITFEDIFPFFSELAAELSRELAESAEWHAALDSFASNVHDFTAFLLPLTAAISEQVGFQVPIAVPLDEGVCNMACYWKEVKFLHGIFIDLLGKMERCLQKMEERLAVKPKGEDEHLHLGWSQYFAILRELHGISKLYQGAEKLYWIKLKNRKVPVCYLILKYAKRSDDNGWILGHKDLTNFEARRHLALMMLPEVRDEYDELHEMLIDRSQLLAESFEYIARADPDALRGGLFMEFKNEEATGPGVLREWFSLVCQAIFNPQNALFVACPNDRRRFFPNPASMVDPLHLEYFNFSGRVIALALMHKVQVGVVFDRVFFLQLAGMKVCLEDIRDADPYLYQSCKQILEMDPETVDQDALGLTFVREVEELGSIKLVELLPNGKSIVVNSSNRKEYVDLLIEHCFVTSIADQVAHFSRGFADIISSSRLQKSFFQSLELEDLDWMLHGSESVSVKDWKSHTEYNGYKETDPQIIWFWKIVGRMSAEQRKLLLFFWTSVKHLPAEGFGGLSSRLYIYKSSESCNRLPSSHTCFYRLCFPPYPSMAVMQDRLDIITQEHVGCSFGTW